jgi:hypothetical protein
MSNRKPFNDRAGYIASRKNPLTNIHNVIYIATEQGIDADGKYITVCEAHGQMVSSANIPNARVDMKDAIKWCSNCADIAGSDNNLTCVNCLEYAKTKCDGCNDPLCFDCNKLLNETDPDGDGYCWTCREKRAGTYDGE